MEKSRFSVVLFSVMLIFQSCHLDGKYDCPKQQTFYQYLDTGLVSKIPYKGYDTLTFVRTSVGDTFTFYGTGFTSGFNERSYTRDMNCPDDISRCEFKQIIFVSPKFTDAITINLFFRNYGEAETLLINFRKQNFYDRFQTILHGPFTYDSINIVNTKYYDVNKITDFEYPNSSAFFVLYHVKGILKFKFTNNETWELVSK